MNDAKNTEPQEIIEAISDAPIALPADPGLLTAEFLRAGDDLILERPDGSTVVVESYFAQSGAPDLVVGGAVVPGRMVAKLSQPRDGGAEAQADEAALDAVGADLAPQQDDAAATAEAGSPFAPLGEPIAEIAELEGAVTIVRADGHRERVDSGAKLYEGDAIETAPGASVGVEFIDGMTFSLGEDARMVLDEFAWAPDSHEGGGLFTILQGRFSFVSGEAAHTGEDALMIETPTMTIGVRGTKVVSQINADGEVSRIALLPEENGRIGKIMVMTDGGSELISEPNQMVEVTSRFEAPSAQRPLSTAEVVQFFGEALSSLPAPAEFQQPEIAQAYDAAHGVSTISAERTAAAEASFADAPQSLREIAQGSSAGVDFARSSDFVETAQAETLLSQAQQAAVEAPVYTAKPAAATASATAAETDPVVETVETELETETETTPETDSAPVFSSGAGAAAAEDVADASTLYTASVTPGTVGDGVTFSLVDDAGGLFEIDPATGVVSLAAGQSLDYETATEHQITIRSTNQAGDTDQTVTIAVTDVNDLGQVFTSGTTASAAENVADGAVLYTATATDADTTGEAIAFSLIDDAGGLFEIDAASGAVSLAAGQSLDYETATSHQITIRSSDGVNATDQTVTFTVTDANDLGQVFTSGATATASESVSDSALIYTATATDADTTGEAITFSLVDDAGGLFEIDAATGAVSLAAGQSLDYETATSHQITIRSSDGVNTTDQTVTFTVTDVDEASLAFTSGALAGAAAETAADADILYAATVANAAGPVTFSLVDDAGGLFEIDPASGEVSLATGQSLDYETATSHQVTVRSSDGVTTVDQIVTFTVTDANDVGQVFTSAAAANVAESVADGAVLYTATATDADTTGEAIAFSLVDDAGGLFEIDAATGAVSLAAGQSLDYETATSHQITIRSSDGVNATDQTVTFTVTDANDLGQVFTSGTTASAAEDVADGAVLYTATATDADTTGEAITFSLVDDAGGLFEIDAASGAVSLAAGQSLDYETATSHQITIRSSDGVNATDQTVTFTVTDVNDAPTLSAAGAVDFSLGDFAVVVGDPGVDSDALDPGDGDMTVEAWFYFDGTSGADRMIVSKGNEIENSDAYAIFLDGSELVVRVGTNGVAVDKTAASSIDLGTEPGWRHVAMVIDNTNGTVTGYLDGDASGWTPGYEGVADAAFDPTTINTNADFVVGAVDNNGYEQWGDMAISDVRVWDVARSQAEIEDDMGRTLNGDEANLVLNLRLDDGLGAEAADSSANAYHGTFSSAGGWLDLSALTTAQDTALYGRVTAADSEGDALTYSIQTNAAHGAATIDAETGAWEYTPDSGYVGLDTISYQVTDGAGGVDTLTVTVTVV